MQLDKSSVISDIFVMHTNIEIDSYIPKVSLFYIFMIYIYIAIIVIYFTTYWLFVIQHVEFIFANI